MIYYLWVTSGFDRIGEAKDKAYKMAEEEIEKQVSFHFEVRP